MAIAAGRMPRLAPLAAALAAALTLLACASAASAQTVASIVPAFTPDAVGARTSTTLTASFSAGAGALPSPVKKLVILLPAGIAPHLQWPRTEGCSRAHLQAHGARGCSPRSQIGSGSALLQWRGASGVASERVSLALFVGPNDGAYTMQLLAEGRRPIRRRLAITFQLFAISAPYSGGMEALIPPIPTLPGQSDASLASFSITVGPTARPAASRRRRATGSLWGEMGIFVPRSCPLGGYPWAADFSYADGASQQATATVPCP
ncbi:MAG: hypothetical protein ACYCU0_06545 [Solirubrobacteraceae bacterium]